MSDKDIKRVIWIIGLKNAVKFDGKPNKKAILGKLMALMPELRTQTKIVLPLLDEIVDEILKLSIEDQKKKLLHLDAHALDKKEKLEERKELPELDWLRVDRS